MVLNIVVSIAVRGTVRSSRLAVISLGSSDAMMWLDGAFV